MRRAPVLAPSAWVAATAVATVVSWLGVGAVTRAVTAAPEPVIPAAAIDRPHPHLNVTPPTSQLVEAAAPPGRTTTTVPIIVHEPTSTVVVPTTVVHPAQPVATTTVPTTQPPKTGGSGSGSGTGTGTGSPPPPQTEKVTFTDAGGSMTVGCTGTTIALESYLTNPGYIETTDSEGTLAGSQTVEVSFANTTHLWVIESQCSGGEPEAVTPTGWGTTPPDPGQF